MHDIDRRLAAQNQYRILALTLGVYTVQQREAGTCINQLSTKSLTRCTCVLLPEFRTSFFNVLALRCAQNNVVVAFALALSFSRKDKGRNRADQHRDQL